MTKKTRNKTLASIVAVVYILATMTACSSEASSSNLSSETGTTSYTDNGSSAPETTTTVETTTPAPETTTTIAETTTLAPETTTQTTTPKPQQDDYAPGEIVEKLNKKMYLTCRGNSYKSPTRENFEWAVLYDVNDEVTVVAKVKGTGKIIGTEEDEGYFYKLKNGTYVPCEWLTDNKNWQAETTYPIFDWQPGDFIVPETPDTDTVIGDLFD